MVRSVLVAGVGGAITALLVAGGEHLGEIASGTDQPLRVTAGLASPFNVCEGGKGWVFHRPPSNLSPASPHQDLNEWAIENGGVPAGGNYLEVQLQGAESRTVIVTGIRLEIIGKRRPPTGAHVTGYGGCGGLVPSFFSANLDREPVRVAAVDGEGPTGEVIPSVPLPHVVSEEKPEVWRLRTKTTRCDCEWVAHIDWVSEGERGSTTIDDEGRPFRTASAGRALEIHVDTDGSWVAADAPTLGPSDQTVPYTEAATLRGSSLEVDHVTLLSQPFPFDEPYRPVAQKAVNWSGGFKFTRRPSVATRYRVAPTGQLRARSDPVTVYVVPLNEMTTKTAKGSGGGRQVGTITARLPERVAALEASQTIFERPAFIYYASRRGKAPPSRLPLVDQVVLHRLSRASWSARFSFPVAEPPKPPVSTKTLLCMATPFNAATGIGSPEPDSQCGRPLWKDDPTAPANR